jgi:hypothetical protein
MSEATSSDIPSLLDIDWNFQMMLPTDAETIAKVQDVNVDSTWLNLLDIDNFGMTVYALQVIVISLLLPRHLFSCLLDYVAKWLTEKMIHRAEGYLYSLVQSGGPKIVLALFLREQMISCPTL